MRIETTLTFLILIPLAAHAQNEPRFSPPRPVVSDPADFDDAGEEDPDFANGGDFPRQAPPGMNPSQGMPGAPVGAPPNMEPAIPFPQESSNPGGMGGPGREGGNKIHFQIVSGVFWHKGMKRTVKHPPEIDGDDGSSPGAGLAPPAPTDNYAPPAGGQMADPSMDQPPPDLVDPDDDPSQF